MAESEKRKKIWKRIDRDDPKITLRDVTAWMEQIQREHPDHDVFFDGDEFAICSWKLEKPAQADQEPPRRRKLRQGKLL